MPARRPFILLLLCLFALPASAQSFQPAPRPLPAAIHHAEDISLERYFLALPQGGSGTLRLSGPEISGASASFLDAEQPFFAHASGAWYALVTADMDARPGRHELVVTVRSASATYIMRLDLRVEQAGFIRQEFDLPDPQSRLVDARVESAELELLAALTAEHSPAPLWDASGFELPLNSPLTSPFGSFRLLNGARQTRHTGWDQVAATGTPIRAMAAGRVVLARRLEIRGNYVLIDHGLGIFTGYAHLSETHASVGQAVRAGQVIGSSGNTGRSSGPHLHWELAVDGAWLDGLAFLDLWLPA